MDEDRHAAIQARFQRVLDQISAAALRSGRVPGTVRLVTVTKSQPVEVVRMAVAAGATILGENYAEEAVPKIAALKGTAVEWHMIGHVQGRKAALVASNFDMLHSLDSARLAGRLERFCAVAGRTLPALLEVNVSGENSKYGLPAWEERLWDGMTSEIDQILACPHLRLTGLMTMPPFTDDMEETRPYFRRLRHLREYLTSRYPQVDWKDLSMGTSSDYIAAIEEGATYVRVGRSILGSRLVEEMHDN